MARRVAVLHSEIAEAASKDEEDTLIQVEVVSESLRRLGFEPTAVPFSFDTRSALQKLALLEPVFVFNLVEAIEGVGKFQHLAPMVLEHARLPFTGASSQALFLTTDKILTKRVLSGLGLPTPESFPITGRSRPSFVGTPRYLVKSVHEDASIGIDDDSVVPVSSAEALEALVNDKQARFGGEWFAERFIEGREFNVGFVSAESGNLRMLPIAEINFEAFPPEKLRICTYSAKWDVDSFEYENTDVLFEFDAAERPLLESLESLACDALDACGISTYARVDFRVDCDGKPWILEINANPCIAPDAAYVTATERAGLSFDALVESIVGPVVRQIERNA